VTAYLRIGGVVAVLLVAIGLFFGARSHESAGARALDRNAVRAPSPSHLCGTTRVRRPYRRVVWVVFENKQYSQIIGSANAPYINSVANQCGLATNFYAEAHPSLPNYIAMTSGSTQGITDDSGPSSHPLSVPSIFSQLGSGWKSLQEGMPSNCYLSNSGNYAVRHNPATYYTNIAGQCAAQDVPLGTTPDLSARFTFITPNLCNDMHSCPSQSDIATETKTGDTWLSGFLPKLLSSSQYTAGNTVIFITWDEDDYNTANNNRIATIVVSPSTPAGAKVTTRYDHYSMLRTTEELLGLSFIGNASSASSLAADFHLR
jgi:phosphatidylinositol-3-phosphatase